MCWQAHKNKQKKKYVVMYYAMVLQHAATPPHNTQRRNFTDCFNISVTLARLQCKLPDDGRGPKHVGAILIKVLM
jgi:hypothetical protein